MATTAKTTTRISQSTATDLQSWVDREWIGGLELRQLAALDRFCVRTRNSVYEFTVLSPDRSEALVRGGVFFPDHTPVHFSGCSLGGSCLKVGAIYPGFLMELLHDGRRIVTTRVHSVTLLPAGTHQ